MKIFSCVGPTMSYLQRLTDPGFYLKEKVERSMVISNPDRPFSACCFAAAQGAYDYLS
jgi:hypothetical protein